MSALPDDIEDLVASYLVGEAQPEEVAFVEKWREQSDENRRYFEHLKLIFEKSLSAHSVGTFDTDRAWEKLRGKLSSEAEARTIGLNPGYKLLMRIAAGVIILITVGVFTYSFFTHDSAGAVRILAEKTTAADTLPDGSDVFLNRETRIEYTFDEETNTHVARLDGEAYFNIHHDDNKVFIVEAHGALIRDIGTSFNVRAYPDSATIEVFVEEGEVKFYTPGDTGLYLKAGGKGTYNKRTKTFAVGQPEPNATAYKTKFFSFSNHSLSTVVETLNGVYDEEIRIDDQLKNCKLTVSFKQEDPDEIAGVIAETLGLTVSRTGNIIYLKGPGCGIEAP